MTKMKLHISEYISWFLTMFIMIIIRINFIEKELNTLILSNWSLKIQNFYETRYQNTTNNIVFRAVRSSYRIFQ